MSVFMWVGYLASLFMGLALGLTGGGGSILTLPTLVYFFSIPTTQATAYSLIIVGVVALLGVWEARKNGTLRLGSALAFGVPGVLGVVVSRRVLLPALPEILQWGVYSVSKDSFLLLVFALLMFAASIKMIADSGKQETETQNVDTIARRLALSGIGLLVGLFAGLVGAGGGFMIVPALVWFAGLRMKEAVGTSLFVIALQSLLGVASDVKSLLALDKTLLVSVIVIAMVGMYAGSKLKQKLSPQKLKLGFGVFVFAMAVVIIFQELSH